MIDVFNLTNTIIQNQVFYTKGVTDWQVWNKPNNCRFIFIMCIGGGGGGGAGQNGAGSTSRQGGGGGGSASVSVAFYPSYVIPDTLFLQVGAGGIGGRGGITPLSGADGNISYVSVESNSTAINILLQSDTASAGGGVVGGAGGTAGTGGTAWLGTGVISDCSFANSVAGQSGTTGGVAGTPTAITIGGVITTGGAGGGGYSAGVNTGGSITGSSFIPTITGGGGNINLNGVDGSGGYCSLNPSLLGSIRQPIFFTGGAGGGTSNNFTGGAGGNASFGSGGGGGVGSTTGGVGANGSGAGGKGGDGLIIITCF